jgi:regulator of protease activity HflC (stomatin/prohibitin superfamily)
MLQEFFIFTVGFTVILALLAALIFNVITVSEGHNVIIEKFGKFDRILTAGVHVIIRFIECERNVYWSYKEEKGLKVKNDSRIDVRGDNIFDPEAIYCITKDNVEVSPNIVVFYKIVDAKMSVYSISNMYDGLALLLSSSLQQEIQQCTLDEYTLKRDSIVGNLKKKLNDSHKWGLSILDITIQSLGLPEKILEVAEELACKEKESIALKRAAESKHDAEMTRQKFERIQQVQSLEMEAEKVKYKRDMEYADAMSKAKIDNDARISKAEAESKAIDIVNTAEKQRIRSMVTSDERLEEYYFALLRTSAIKSLNEKASVLIVPPEMQGFFTTAKVFNALSDTTK